MGEAIFNTMDLGYNRILILSNSKGLVQVCNRERNPSWLTLPSDLNQFMQQGTHYLFVPKEVISHVIDLAFITSFPVYHCRLNPNFV